MGSRVALFRLGQSNTRRRRSVDWRRIPRTEAKPLVDSIFAGRVHDRRDDDLYPGREGRVWFAPWSGNGPRAACRTRGVRRLPMGAGQVTTRGRSPHRRGASKRDRAGGRFAGLLRTQPYNDWNRAKTAKGLGIHKTTLFRKIQKLGIALPERNGRSRP